ncbi:uncharacterized protein [Nicotiana sylvestris]|uniref:uncharacterized protein n=1 Tax=Nicotiana sylvestris TaxID=4096 RepID=UPI00388CC52D
MLLCHFDMKPFIVKTWTPEFGFSREELLTVPFWIKFPGLDYKYWNKKGLSKIGSLVGKHIMVDQNIEKRNGMNFARLLVEVGMNAKRPDVVLFRNERSKLIKQKVIYDWKPILCSYCSIYGHAEEVCRIKKKLAMENAEQHKEMNNVAQTEPKNNKSNEQIPVNFEQRKEETSTRTDDYREQMVGIHIPNKQKEVKLLCNEERVGLVGLLETKIKSNRIEKLANNMFVGWKYLTNLEYHYNGRIWITWRPDYYKVILMSMLAQVIKCEVHHIPLQMTFELCYVYALNTREERKDLWDKLVSHSRRCTRPWMVLGDFNSILKTEDIIGRNPVTWAEVKDFHNCVVECGLLELPAQGNRYSWNDKHEEQRIFSKID